MNSVKRFGARSYLPLITTSIVLTINYKISDSSFGSTSSDLSHCKGTPNRNSMKTNYGPWNSNWDLRGNYPQIAASNETISNSSVIRQIVLIRHGQYVHSEIGDEKQGLTELGNTQAELTGKRLKALIDDKVIFPLKEVRYSTMRRATETFEKVKPQLPQDIPSHSIQPCSMIREGAVCKAEPMTMSWEPSDEELLKDGTRVEAAFRQYFHRADLSETDNYSLLLVSHGNVIRYLIMRALQLPPEAWLRLAVWNGSITIIEIHGDGRVSLRCLGDVGHFHPKQITYN